MKSWRGRIESRLPNVEGTQLLERWTKEGLLGASGADETAILQQVRQQVIEPLSSFYTGVTQYVLGYHAEAAENLEAFLDGLDPDDASPLAHYYLGLAYQKLGQPAMVRIQLREYLRQSGAHAEGSSRYAAALESLRTIEAGQMGWQPE